MSELLQEAAEVLRRGQADEQMFMAARIEAAEQERDEWRESARTANTALLKVCKERDELLEAAKIDLTEKRIVTDELRIDRNAWKAYAAKLEKAGDAMYGCSAVDFDKACVAWEAARKDKPGA